MTVIPAATRKSGNSWLIEILECPHCGGELVVKDEILACRQCSSSYPFTDGIPRFTKPPQNLRPSEKYERGPQVGTPWRQANWRFLEEQLKQISPGAHLLDVGAGRGDFANLTQNHLCVALDIYPYPEIDIICDLTQINPFRTGSLDAILLMNVLEHVYDTHALFRGLARILAPGGLLILAIPFMVKMHQVPIDFVRYTHFALAEIAKDHGLEIMLLEGYYDPVFFLGEGLGNLRNSILPDLKRRQRYLIRPALAGIEVLRKWIGTVLGPGKSIPPGGTRSLAPTGYQVVFRKKH